MTEELSASQLAYLEWFVSPNREGSKEGWAKAHATSYQTIRKWENTAWFRDAADRKLTELNVTPDRVQEMMESIHRAGKAGDVAAAKYYMEWVRSVRPAAKLEEASIEALTDEELERAWREGLATVVAPSTLR